ETFPKKFPDLGGSAVLRRLLWLLGSPLSVPFLRHRNGAGTVSAALCCAAAVLSGAQKLAGSGSRYHLSADPSDLQSGQSHYMKQFCAAKKPLGKCPEVFY